MADNTGGSGEGNGGNAGGEGGNAGGNTPDIDAIVAQKVAEALKPIKTNLDNAYAARDAAAAEAETLKKEKRDAEIARLTEEGKHREAADLKVREADARAAAAEARAIELTRDSELKTAMSAYTFRNPNAFNMAYADLVKELVRNDKGVWVHKSGVDVAEYVKSFAAKPDNVFLFEQKPSTGGGGGNVKPSGDTDKSVFEMSQEEVLKRASEGTLPKKKR